MAEDNRSGERLFAQLLDLPEAERDSRLREATLHSPELRAKVQGWLDAYMRMQPARLASPAPANLDVLPRTQVKPGSRIGRYLIERSIGAGGMGEVYRAHDTTLNRTVAVKILPLDKTTDRPAALRFLNEARLASSLNHPNIVALYDIAKHHEVDFLVMEYVQGQTLRQLIPEGGMQFHELTGLGSQIALALGAAHAAGIVHRDIKPANIMVTSEQQAKVLDFGLAKRDRNELDTQLTGEGMIIGTIAYMSPEQTRGEPLDARSDIFSFGCVLYEAATGLPPFDAGNALALMHQINTSNPKPVHAHRPALNPQFARLVMRCLAKDRTQRPDSAMELATELKSLDFATAPVPRVEGHRHTSLAVLPLQVRGESSNQFLSTSLADALVHRLSTVGDLVVRPLASTLRYAGDEVDWTTPARELNVDLVVAGTIQSAGGRIRVLVQVHRRSDLHTLASIKQDGESSDLFALQDRLADAVSNVFVPQTPSAKVEYRTPPTNNPAAFELYLRAVDRQVRVETFEMTSAIDLLTRATQLDPNFADAWGLLAQACAQMGSHLDSDPKWFEAGERAIARALELDPVQCTALCARSMILWSPSRSFQNRAALRALNAALKIDSTRPTARHQRSAILWHQGFTRAAEADASQLVLTNPALGTMHQAAIALYSGNFDRSAELYSRALEIEPNGVLNHVLAPVATLYAGRLDEAHRMIANARQIFPAESFGIAIEAILAAIQGHSLRAESLADEAARSTHSMTHTHHTRHSCAAAYALCGKTDKAMHELERCAAMGLPNHRLFQLDPYLQSLRDLPRFQQLSTALRREHDAVGAEFGLED